jgi:hypothetical protein
MNWQIFSNWIGDKKMWQIARIKDPSKVLHSGNMESTGKWFDSREEAQAALAEMTKEVAV